MGCCAILLKPHIISTMFIIEIFAQLRQPRVSVQNAVGNSELKPRQLPHFPVLLRSEVSQEMSVSMQNLFV
jgi:hypothetical protein